MPGRDGKGPFGTFKECKPTEKGNPLYLRRFCGRGLMHRYFISDEPTKSEEIKFLKDQVESMKERLDELKKD